MENCPLSSKDQLVSSHLQETFHKNQPETKPITPSSGFLWGIKRRASNSASVRPELCWVASVGQLLLQQPLETGSLVTHFQMRTLRLSEVKSMAQHQIARSRCISLETLVPWLPGVCPVCLCRLYVMRLSHSECIFLISGLKWNFILFPPFSTPFPCHLLPCLVPADQPVLGKWTTPRPQWVGLDCVLLYTGGTGCLPHQVWTSAPPPCSPEAEHVTHFSVETSWHLLQQLHSGDFYLHGCVPPEPVEWRTRCQSKHFVRQDSGMGRRSAVGPLGSLRFPEPPFAHLQTGAKDSLLWLLPGLVDKTQRWGMLFSVHFETLKCLTAI